MNKYLSADLRFVKSDLEALRSSVKFTLSMVPKDLPFNPGYGVEVPSDVLASDFCDSYKNNLIESFRFANLPVTVESVESEGRNLVIKLKYNNNKLETWRLAI